MWQAPNEVACRAEPPHIHQRAPLGTLADALVETGGESGSDGIVTLCQNLIRDAEVEILVSHAPERSQRRSKPHANSRFPITPALVIQSAAAGSMARALARPPSTSGSNPMSVASFAT